MDSGECDLVFDVCSIGVIYREEVVNHVACFINGTICKIEFGRYRNFQSQRHDIEDNFMESADVISIFISRWNNSDQDYSSMSDVVGSCVFHL